jgi:acylphosphatase
LRNVHVIVHGRVQGVGYRAFLEERAMARGLTGWVRNRRDGSVEAHLSGRAENIAAVIEACRKGPRLALVDEIHVRDVPDEGWAEFTVRTTV